MIINKSHKYHDINFRIIKRSTYLYAYVIIIHTYILVFKCLHEFIHSNLCIIDAKNPFDAK